MASFPTTLLQLLSTGQYPHAIGWNPNGSVWIDPKPFQDDVLKGHFPTVTKFASFTRKLNRYGFRKVTKREGAVDKVCHYGHPIFRPGINPNDAGMIRIHRTARSSTLSLPSEPSKQQMSPTDLSESRLCCWASRSLGVIPGTSVNSNVSPGPSESDYVTSSRYTNRLEYLLRHLQGERLLATNVASAQREGFRQQTVPYVCRANQSIMSVSIPPLQQQNATMSLRSRRNGWEPIKNLLDTETFYPMTGTPSLTRSRIHQKLLLESTRSALVVDAEAVMMARLPWHNSRGTITFADAIRDDISRLMMEK